MAETIRSERWATLTLELVLVVLGILLAFQLDRAYQAAQDRALERRYLVRLHLDLERDLMEVDRVLALTAERGEQRRLGFGEEDQDRFRLETVGLLSGEQLAAIEDPDRFALDVSTAEARRIAVRLAARTDAHAWLERLAKYQVLMARLARDHGDRARALMTAIDRELEPAS